MATTTKEIITIKGATMKILGIAPDGRTVVEHDGSTEWADCSACGSHIDGASDTVAARTGGWDGSCPYCGAAAEFVGLESEGEVYK